MEYKEPKWDLLRFHDAIAFGSNVLGAMLVYQAEPCSWLSKHETVQAEKDTMLPKQKNTHFTFASSCCFVP